MIVTDSPRLVCRAWRRFAPSESQPGPVMAYRFDPAGAAVSNTGQTFACLRDFNVPFLADKATSSLFMVAAGQNEVESSRVDLNSGQETSRQDYPAGSGPWTIAVSPPQ